MSVFVVVLLLLVAFPRQAHSAARALADAMFEVLALLESLARSAMVGMFGWLRKAEAGEPRGVLLGLLLFGLAGPVAYADYSVLAATLGLIWPSDQPPAWLAFSIVAVTASVGMLVHIAKGLLPRLALTALACLLIGAQGTVAYLRASQLEEIRRISEAGAPTADEGDGLVPGQTPVAPPAPAPVLSAPPDRRGSVMAAVIAGLLCFGQIAGVWGGVHFAGAALVWVISFPAFVVLAFPWVALKALSSSAVCDGLRSVLEAVFGVLEASHTAIMRAAPFPWTAASADRRSAQRRRIRLADLEEREDANAEQFRLSVEAEIRDAERVSLRDFLGEYLQRRGVFFRDLLEESLRSARAGFGPLPDTIVKMWFWPLNKAWRLLTIVGGASRFPPRARDDTDKSNEEKANL